MECHTYTDHNKLQDLNSKRPSCDATKIFAIIIPTFITSGSQNATWWACNCQSRLVSYPSNSTVLVLLTKGCSRPQSTPAGYATVEGSTL